MDYGLSRLNKLTARFSNLEKKMESIVAPALAKHTELMADLNRLQLQAGITADGTPIRPPYAPLTVSLKKKKGQPFDRVTLRDEGDFQEAIEARKFGKTYILRSRNWKAIKLQQKYGDNIFGLTSENLRIVEIAALPDVKQQLRNYLLLKF